MGDYTLTEAETWAINRLVCGEEADLGQLPIREFRADTLRRLMLHLPLNDDGSVIKLTGMGVRLKGATITGGIINLEHGSLSDGSAMPRLSLESCEIKDGINLKSARLHRLCLKNAKISEMLADHVHISGLLDIRGLSAHPQSNRPGVGKPGQMICRLSLCGAHIEDGIEAGGAFLVAPLPNPNYIKYSERSTYALDLPEARINGDIRLFPDFTACGGVNINGAKLGGSLHAHGGHFTSAQLHSLDACGAHIAGNLALDSRITSEEERDTARKAGNRKPVTIPFTCDGELNLNNVTIGEDLRLFGAKIYGERSSISAEHITVKGDAYFSAFDDGIDDERLHDSTFSHYQPTVFRFFCANRIDLRGANIGGDLSFRGAKLGGELDISASQIGGHLLFSPMWHNERRKRHQTQHSGLDQRFETSGKIKLDGTRVKGNLIFRGALIQGKLKAYGMQIEGYASFSPHIVDGDTPRIWRFEAQDTLTLANSVIAQKLDFTGAYLHGEFLAPNITVGGKLLMCAFAPKVPENYLDYFDADKRINLSGAKIQSDFDLTGARLRRGLRFRGGQVSSALIIDVFNAEPAEPDGTDIKSLPSSEKRSIDLFNAHANMLSDLSYTGERKLGYDTDYVLRLEGFSYGRFPHFRDDESLAESERFRRDTLRRRLNLVRRNVREIPEVEAYSLEDWLQTRMDWLNCQYKKGRPTRMNYNPDPFNTLYKFYKRMGAQDLADRVLKHKLRTERLIKAPWSKQNNSTKSILKDKYKSSITLNKNEKNKIKILKNDYRLRLSKINSEKYTKKVTILIKNICHQILNFTLSVIFFIFDRLFGFGLNPARALLVFVLYTVILTTCFWVSDYKVGYVSHPPIPIYKDVTIPAFPVLTFGADTSVLEGRFEVADDHEKKGAAVNCATERYLYSSATYAAETIIPYFDINERDHCDFTSKSGTFWGWIKVIAALIGWVITSVTVLTWTGIFRRNVEP